MVNPHVAPRLQEVEHMVRPIRTTTEGRSTRATNNITEQRRKQLSTLPPGVSRTRIDLQPPCKTSDTGMSKARVMR